MGALVSVLNKVPDDPMIPEWIGIQSRGMKQWIFLEIAKQFGVCSNMLFLYPRQIVDNILTGFTPPENQQYGFDEDRLFWSVMKLISENRDRTELSSVNTYIKEDDTGNKLYQLSSTLAKVFDDYQAYRPDMLVDWQKKPLNELSTDPVAQWQAALWRQIVSNGSQNHLAVSAWDFLKKKIVKAGAPGHVPSRISLFGISAFPDVFLKVFEKMSEIIDINLFLLSPSNQFFFDIKSEREIGKIAIEKAIDPNRLYYEVTNPLLSSLGTAGKSFHARIEAYDYNEPCEDLFQDPLEEAQTLLTYLQSDILNLVHRKKDGDQSPVLIKTDDTSVCIHACHSPMRETQVLKDLLLRELEKDPELFPHDIIVMLPDIEAYAPFIESVFSLENTLPFSISDRRKKSESEPLDAFLKILELNHSRLGQSDVLNLLLSETIAGKFGIATDEIGRIEKIVQDANIVWGRDAEHRQTFGLPPFEENTWQFGLQRLFMGMVMPENMDEPVEGILPCPSFEGLDLEVLGKFAGFCHALFSCLEILAGNKTMGQWCRDLKKITADLMEWNFSNGEDFSFLHQTIDQIYESSIEAEYKAEVSFEVISSLIKKKLDLTIPQGNFLGGNITFCNIMPMRSIPFKIVVLMGMEEKSFPRQAFDPGFNLIKKYPESGDKNQRDEDRYLFLETLLSARSKFIITYTGLSLKDNSILPCSGVVSELLDYMAQGFVFEEGYDYHLYHLLHPFNEDYFNSCRSFFSFSADNCAIANSLSRDRSAKSDLNDGVFLRTMLSESSDEKIASISLDDLVRFFNNPLAVFMEDKLNVRMRNIDEQTIDREAFSLSGLDQYSLGSFLVEKNKDTIHPADFYPVLKAMGTLPFGMKGRLEYEKLMTTAGPVIEVAQALEQKKQLPDIFPGVTIEGVTLSSNFSNIREDGVYNLTFGKLNGARLLSGWIRHLFFNLCAPSEYPKETHLIGRDPKGKQSVLVCSFPPMNAPLNYFKGLLEMYQQGRQTPFYFFRNTSWEFARILYENKFEVNRETVFQAMNNSKVKTSWNGGHFQTGEKENRYISLCIENNDPFDSVDALISSGFVENAVTVYRPLLENLEIQS